MNIKTNIISIYIRNRYGIAFCTCKNKLKEANKINTKCQLYTYLVEEYKSVQIQNMLNFKRGFLLVQ